MTITDMIALVQSRELGGTTGRPRDVNIYIRNEDGSETRIMDSDSHFIVTGAGDGMLFTDIDLTIINSPTLRKEESADCLAAGISGIAHAADDKDGEP